MSFDKLKIFSDGGARGNPGPAGIGAIVYDLDNNVVAEVSEYIGETTNNQAEYQACLAGMKKAGELGASEVEFFLDSELVVKQLNGEYRVKNKVLASLFVKISNEKLKFKQVNFKHVRREFNKEADRLANLAMDKAQNS